MEAPFIFGKIANEKNFTDRVTETERLIANFTSGVNTILISPRRWGKSSLVRHVVDKVRNESLNIVFIFIDLHNIRSEEQFYQVLAQEIFKSTASRLDEIFENSRKFLGRFIPKLSFSPVPGSEFTLGLDWQEVKQQPDDVLNLAEKIASEKGIKVIICIDEFQNIAEFESPLAFQKQLRANWQTHQNTSYCLYGSKRHLMTEVFSSYSMPFYKFGDLMFLDKIGEEDWVRFITQKFRETDKNISLKDARLISTLAECHPYYVQQVAQLSWLRSLNNCSTEIVNEAFESLVLQLSLLFQTITDGLTNTQISFLKAIIQNVDKLSSKENLSNFKLGTSANVLRLRQALINKEVIDIQKNKIEFLDPVYKYWLTKYYFSE
ncbi:MAG TPA: ATP-binding protein [Bacteroidales bacterium]